MTAPSNSSRTYSRTTAKGAVVILRPMTAADLDVVAAIEASVHSHPWSRDSFTSSLAAGHDCWVAEAGQRPLGYLVAAAGGGEAELLNISVAAADQGQGIGAVLLDFVVAQVAPKAELLFLEVRPSNAAAIDLYHSRGFNEVGVRPNYYPRGGGREDALIFARVLSGDEH
ncbi:ribosomal-protein-alanine N-acetyltransferase [Exilibacterium tricleocarpae]|uniref:[Ribosomal protein bS18]-alanine N-acetyltransferase n=1 Tax=Exilibacterium tricleocarpae TaxID=2591008 RepID=A0A545TS43_9GAMM|nr:ribosomal protein S18-alanine N-acetyltransferase [Exilibacterium tricleocarpae]TQV80033.1 ribosomal-protein-alanine N-acetyltransferase [Exilibacterium tricleocarpae]